MANRMIRTLLLGLTFTLMSCSMMVTPKFEELPKLPEKFGISGEHILSNSCIDLSGKYNIKPISYRLNKSGELLETSVSNRFSFIHLFGLGKKKIKNIELINYPSFAITDLVIEQLNSTEIKILNRNLKDAVVHFSVLSKLEKDFTCSANITILKESSFKGGAEGTQINYRSYRDLRLLENGDLLLYEQLAYPYRVEHNYFLFQRLL